MTFTITGDQVWSIGKYVLAALGGVVVCYVFCAIAAWQSFKRWW